MELRVLGSSSAGNCYLLDNGKECLVLECGVSFTKVRKSLGNSIDRIVGALVSHEHGDHARYIHEFSKRYIPVYASQGTITRLRWGKSRIRVIEAGGMYEIGGFRVKPFKVEHDASEPLGFLIYHEEMGLTLFATDTYYLRYRFPRLNNIMIEANYKEDLLIDSVAKRLVDYHLMRRTKESHMSVDMCIDFLEKQDLGAVNNIVLLHLSSYNSDRRLFRRMVSDATLKSVTIAESGLVLPFNKEPF